MHQTKHNSRTLTFWSSTVGVFSYLISPCRDRICLGEKLRCVSTITYQTHASDESEMIQSVSQNSCGICLIKMDLTGETLLRANCHYVDKPPPTCRLHGLKFIPWTDICLLLHRDRSAPFYSDAWVKGVRDWQHLSARTDSHAESQIHTGACVMYEQWRRNGRIDVNMERDARNDALEYLSTVIGSINITITLATCNMSLRGHREITGESNSGNFLNIIQLLACYDPVLKELLERPQGSVKYLSPAVQNEIIYIIAKQVQCDIQDHQGQKFHFILAVSLAVCCSFPLDWQKQSKSWYSSVTPCSQHFAGRGAMWTKRVSGWFHFCFKWVWVTLNFHQHHSDTFSLTTDQNLLGLPVFSLANNRKKEELLCNIYSYLCCGPARKALRPPVIKTT